MINFESILDEYKSELKQNPVLAELISSYSQDRLKVYLILREHAQNENLPLKTRELFLTILGCLEDDVNGAASHAGAAIEAGLTIDELVQEFAIVSIALGSDDLSKTCGEVIKVVETNLEK